MRFRRLTDGDLPMLHRWLNEPGVVAWWEGNDVSPAAVERDYGSTSQEPVEHWIALVDGVEVGWIQCYALADYADEEETRALVAAGVDPLGAGIDYLVAEPSARGRGLGSVIIRAFVEQVVFSLHQWTQAAAGPYLENVASWRALEKAGFRHLGDYQDAEGDPCRVMVRDRPAGSGSP